MNDLAASYKKDDIHHDDLALDHALDADFYPISETECLVCTPDIDLIIVRSGLEIIRTLEVPEHFVKEMRKRKV